VLIVKLLICLSLPVCLFTRLQPKKSGKLTLLPVMLIAHWLVYMSRYQVNVMGCCELTF